MLFLQRIRNFLRPETDASIETQAQGQPAVINQRGWLQWSLQKPPTLLVKNIEYIPPGVWTLPM